MRAAERGELAAVFHNHEAGDPFDKKKDKKKHDKKNKKKKRVERPRFNNPFDDNGMMLVNEEEEQYEVPMAMDAEPMPVKKRQTKALKEQYPQKQKQENFEVYTDAPAHLSYMEDTMLRSNSRAMNNE